MMLVYSYCYDLVLLNIYELVLLNKQCYWGVAEHSMNILV